MKRLLTLALVVLGATAFAQSSINVRPCCDPCDRGNITVEAELLIWRAIDCSNDYALGIGSATVVVPSPPVFTIYPKFDLGVRVGARYDCGCWFADARYIYFTSANSEGQVDVNNLLFGEGIAATLPLRKISTKLRTQYQDADLRWAAQGPLGKCLQLFAYIGGRFANIEMRRNIKGTQVTGDFQSSQAKSTYNGGGVAVGFGANACILSCLHLTTELGAVGLLGSRDFSYLRTGFVAATNFTQRAPSAYQSTTDFVPGVDLRAKLAYVKTVCKMDFSLYLAWELHQYWDSVILTDPVIAFTAGLPAVDVSQTAAKRACRNVGFGGPSVGLSVGF